MLPECDYVAVVLPLTEATHHAINTQRLARMKRSAFLINIGRGSLIDEPALIAALLAGQLAGAALDVFEKEPLPSTSPLWSLPNVILTPHISGWTTRYDELAFQIFADNLERYLAGEALYNEVDRVLGY
jgi:phosphoglycerate dehydrogenase-like enzyme